ncbi:MAG: undecaprenyl/decaprenyl-phosphate alpha-N-acetylglucosaminyl 1-phosphate transferase [Armatimonadota bacterium]|nr:undecaprenyl/decaprenyl-phosphate alpha-N-acetylglucosaminyl 1-phosphate transferase [Armatimonadota bacterium]
MKIMPWAAFALALLLTFLLTPLVRKLAFRFGAVAVPRERDVHKQPLPRWGGLAMVGGFLLTLGIVYLYIVTHRHVYPWHRDELEHFAGVLIAAALVALVGALDDKYEVSALWQALALIGAGVVLIGFGVRIEGITNPVAHPSAHPSRHGYDPSTFLAFPLWFSALGTILWVFGVAKTVDFIDGLDGLAAGVCAICGTTLALMSAQAGQYEVTIIAAALVGVCLGFLRYNYHPATIIMGTVGAQFLGFVLAAIAVMGTFKIAAFVSVFLPVLVLGIPIFDGIRVVGTRAINKTPAHLPNKTSHIHHVLLKRYGGSQRKTVWAIYGLTTCFCLAALLLFRIAGH